MWLITVRHAATQPELEDAWQCGHFTINTYLLTYRKWPFTNQPKLFVFPFKDLRLTTFTTFCWSDLFALRTQTERLLLCSFLKALKHFDVWWWKESCLSITENNGWNAVFFMAKTKRWPSSCGKTFFFGNFVLVRNQMCWSFPDSENASSVSR